jgi:hypothetical protein
MGLVCWSWDERESEWVGNGDWGAVGSGDSDWGLGVSKEMSLSGVVLSLSEWSTRGGDEVRSLLEWTEEW